MDKYKRFAVFTLFVSLFFMFVVTGGSERVLFLGGILYSLVFFFHSRLERFFASRTSHAIRAYGIGVLANGLIVEILAYASNTDKIRAGQEVFLFATSSLPADLLIGFPYYLTFALIFAWAVRKYYFSVFSLGVTIFIGQAMTVDIFSHLFQLLAGNIIGFLMAGLMMLFTLHAPIVLFSSKIQEQYPNRSRSWVRYPLLVLLQLIPLVITFIIVFIKFNILHL
jgi:hypothetical protein